MMSDTSASQHNAKGPRNGDVPAIVFEHVTKTFPQAPHPAVSDVSLRVPRGSLVVLLGPSGCGKTTLLKLTNRLYEYDSGRILIEGQDSLSFKATDLRRHIGYVIQSTGLFPHMNVAKNIGTVPEMLGWDKERTRTRVDELLELVGLPPAEYRERYPAQLSGGQQQRVGLARAMAADPSVMLMDEPFAAIDNITRRRLQDELLMIQAKVRKTILFVTHDVEEAIRLADKIAVMCEGRVVQYDTPLNILTAPADDFVAQLVGGGDVLRRLSLLDVQSAMSETRNGSLPAVAGLQPDDSLRSALSLFLADGSDALPVVNAGGRQIGVLTLEDIREALRVRTVDSSASGAAPPAGER